MTCIILNPLQRRILRYFCVEHRGSNILFVNCAFPAVFVPARTILFFADLNGMSNSEDPSPMSFAG